MSTGEIPTNVSARRGRPPKRKAVTEAVETPVTNAATPVGSNEMQELREIVASLAQQQQQTTTLLQQYMNSSTPQQQPQATNAQPAVTVEQPPPAPTVAQPPESMYERFRRINPPQFEGGPDPLIAQTWIKELEKLFAVMKIPESSKLSMAIMQLKGNAENWWETVKPFCEADGAELTWQKFKEVFFEQYFSKITKREKEKEFMNLQQRPNETVLEYSYRFNELGRFCTRLIKTEEDKAIQFEYGLKQPIRDRLSSQIFDDYQDVFQRAQKIESELKRNGQDMIEPKRPRFDRGPSSRPQQQKNGGRKWQNGNGQKLERCKHCNRFHRGPCYQQMGVCFTCGKPGHLSFQCPNRKVEATQPKPVE